MDKIEVHSFKIPDKTSVGFIEQFAELQKAAKELSESLSKQFKSIERVSKELGGAIRKYAEQLQPSLTKLAEHGWYICGNSAMSDSFKLAIELREGNVEKVDSYLMDFYEVEFKAIINNTKKMYPERKKVINEAQRAHYSKMYYASTSLFLATADGIFNGQLFKAPKKGKPSLKKQIKQTKHLKEYGELLTNMFAIDAVYKDINLFSSSLNRHGVMHGLDFDYGTKINSLKSLSLLAFICDFFDRKEG